MKYFYILGTCVALGGFALAAFLASVPAGETDPAPEQEYTFSSSTSYFERGEYYFNTNGEVDGPYDRERARFFYQKAIKEGEEDELLWYQLGRLDFLDGDYASAIERFNTQIELYGDTVPNVYYGLGLVYGFMGSENKIEADLWKGVEYFKTFQSLEPNSPWVRVDLSWVLFELKEFEQMIPLLEEGLEDYPDNPWLLNMYGLALMNTGHRAQAIEVFEQSLVGAKQLTVEEWGQAYSGNNNASWEAGLEQFIFAIEKNIEINNARLAEE
jgi:tetratricopeptide (TPR) repeat protein